MAETLLDWVANLISDHHSRASFDHDPRGYAGDHGFHDLSGADLHDVLVLLADNGYSHSDHGHHHFPPPHHWHHGDHESGEHYLRHYINSHHDTWERWDRGDTHVDNSVHQDIDTGRDHEWGHDRDHDWNHDRDHDRDGHRDHDRDGHRDHDRDGDRDWDRDRDHRGGDFHQTIDNDPVTASGRGSVAAGHDISDSTLTSGHGNVVGDGDQGVTGGHGTTAFGSGDATNAHLSHSHVGDGGSVSVGGDARGYASDDDTRTSVHGHGSGSTAVNTAGAHGSAAASADQHESDSSTHSHYTDDSDTDSHDHLNSGNDVDYHDSHDFEVHH